MKLATIAGAVCLCTATAFADGRPDAHAPIGVMGDHLHDKGEVMFSYRFMQMSMEGNRVGSSSISADEIVTTIPNRFTDLPMMPPTLRVVPTEMIMQMHMFGVMYAPSDRVTLMAMLKVLDKSMDHTTYMGPAGTVVLGNFTTETSGLGDTRIAALIRWMEDDDHRVHATLGVSLPTGSTDETGNVLTPMNTEPTLRLPYPMQLGSGTWDLIAGLTYAGNGERWGWGSQWQSLIRTGDNDEGYTLGDEHTLTGWASYLVGPRISLSGRVTYIDRGNIDGIDPMIAAPVQTADPDRQGIERSDLSVGANLVLPGDRHRLALEFWVPLTERLAGPQLETDWQVTLGWQMAL
ncbi:MAG: transporter [Gammaproteobacteria bacterium]|nr:transporter [Gammaproteobacteria bacterium]NNL50093.1 transporter [Woeseiaceae bacterium]